MTYRGHDVLETLVRAYFSPLETTAQAYIVTGSAAGSIHVYDVLTGEPVTVIPEAHGACVRDVAWHPHAPLLASASFDGRVSLWDYDADEGE